MPLHKQFYYTFGYGTALFTETWDVQLYYDDNGTLKSLSPSSKYRGWVWTPESFELDVGCIFKTSDIIGKRLKYIAYIGAKGYKMFYVTLDYDCTDDWVCYFLRATFSDVGMFSP